MDADDYWENNHLSNLVNLIQNYSDKVDMFSAASKQIQNGKFVYPKLSKYENYTGIVDFFKVSLISNGFIHTSSVCVKRDTISKNLFPYGMNNFEDIITWARIANNKGFAFSSERTSVYVIDNVETSARINFGNYIKFSQLLTGINYNYFKLKIYLVRFLLLHILYARMIMSFNNYVKSFFNVFGKNYIITLILFIVLFLPKSIIKFFKDYRKIKQ